MKKRKIDLEKVRESKAHLARARELDPQVRPMPAEELPAVLDAEALEEMTRPAGPVSAFMTHPGRPEKYFRPRGRPQAGPTRKSKTLAIRLSPDLVEALDRYMARETGRRPGILSYSEIARYALQRFLAEHEEGKQS
jgi:hypothetical protein